MKIAQLLTNSVLAILPISFIATPTYSFNLIDKSINIPLPYKTLKGQDGIVWVDPIQKLSPPSEKFLQEFRKQFPDWEFSSSYRPVYGDLVVNNYTACNPNLSICNSLGRVGGLLDLDYIPKKYKVFDPELGREVEYTDFPDPNTGQVHWIQWVESNHSISPNIHGLKERVIDTTSNTPFYYGEFLGKKFDDPLYFFRNQQDPYQFYDTSLREDPHQDHDWTANLFLAYQTYNNNGEPKKVEIFGGVRWGWHNVIQPSCPTPSNLKAQIEEEGDCKLDLALVFDTTGSMEDEIDEVKESATEIITKLFAKIPDSRVSIVDYQDQYPNGLYEDYPYNAVLPFSDSITNLSSAINSLTLGHGGDLPESAYTALMNTLQGNQIGSWREDAEKAIIIFTDAPPHDPEPITGYTFNDVVNASKNPFTININSASFLNNNTTHKPVAIYSVLFEEDEDALNVFSELSKQTGGKVYQSTDIVKSLFEAITDIEEDISNSPSPSVPEPSNLFALSIIGLLGIWKCRKI